MNCQLHSLSFEVPPKKQIARKHTLSVSKRAQVRMQTRLPVAGENFMIPSWRPCELLNWAGPFDPRIGAHRENLLPVKHFTKLTYMTTSCFLSTQEMSMLKKRKKSRFGVVNFSFSSSSSSSFWLSLQLEQMFVVCACVFLLVLSTESLTCLSPSQIRQRISQARSHYWNA